MLTKRINNIERSKTYIAALKPACAPEGVLAADGPGIASVVTDFYTDLFAAEPMNPTAASQVLNCITSKLTMDQRNSNDIPLTDEELKQACQDLRLAKASGPDGLPAEFYQAHWDILQPHMRRLYQNIEAGTPPPGFTEALVVLLYKKGSRQDIANYRPISLLNTDYKIFAKAWASRTQALLPHLIDPSQTGFVRGRYIKDNVMALMPLL